MELLDGESVIWKGRPSWRSNFGWYATWIGASLLPAILAGAIKKSGREPVGGYSKWLVVTFLLILLVIIVDVLRRNSTRYTVTSQRIQIRRGILSRQERSTHLDRVQNVNTNQSLIERVLKVGAVDFDTAGSDPNDAELRFRGVSDPHGLVRELQPHISRNRGVATPR
jgi:uncharacterized membrane protein YdbT with pleckstrin-like domain